MILCIVLVMLNLNPEIKRYIESVEISHSFAKNYSHGIRSNGSWELFEPTRFVYAFFSFNMIFSINWPVTLKFNKKLKYFRQRDGEFAKWQIESLVNFIHQADSSCFKKCLVDFKEIKNIYQECLNMPQDFNSERRNLYTGNTIAHDFMTAAKLLNDGLDLTSEDHFNLLQMAYAVRNNLFHGEKKALLMREEGHRRRLYHYGSIILATNESFFTIIENVYKYYRIESWEVDGNI